MRNIIFTFLFLTVFTSLFAQEVKVIQWYNLVSDEVEFDDPFEKLTEDQIYDLSYVAKMRMLKERKPGSVGDESLKTIEEKEKNSPLKELTLRACLPSAQLLRSFGKRGGSCSRFIKRIIR